MGWKGMPLMDIMGCGWRRRGEIFCIQRFDAASGAVVTIHGKWQMDVASRERCDRPIGKCSKSLPTSRLQLEAFLLAKRWHGARKSENVPNEGGGAS